METRVRPEIKDIITRPNAYGEIYTLQEIRNFNAETGEQISHYDDEDVWYRVLRHGAEGMPLGGRNYGPNKSKAIKYLRNKTGYAGII